MVLLFVGSSCYLRVPLDREAAESNRADRSGRDSPAAESRASCCRSADRHAAAAVTGV